MKHLFENETDYEYEFQDLDDLMTNEDGCGWGGCEGTCYHGCGGTGWCLNNIGR